MKFSYPKKYMANFETIGYSILSRMYLLFLYSVLEPLDIKENQGVRKQIFYGGARRNEKSISCEISKFLLHKSKKDGGAQAPSAPPVPHPLID